MVISKKLLYMALGGILTLSMIFGAYATFAQTDEGSDDATPAEGDDTTDTTPETPLFDGHSGQHGFARSADGLGKNEDLLAEELGVTVEELQAAYEEVRVALIEQAVADGLLTQEQADQLLSGTNGPVGGRGFMPHGLASSDVDVEEMLADALGVSVDELQAAREAVNAARLEQMIEDGVITQEQVDLMQARQAVQDYLDIDAINDSIQTAYEAAIEQALADGVITQEQADQMSENIPSFNGFAGPRGGHGFHGGPHGFHGQGGDQSSFGQTTPFGNGVAPLQGDGA
ncbi:MAG: hypothetical protein KC421_26365 [Anaerolineales bacterium]|nr:hypothetical protein [Anaerolineales bacterium]